MLEKIIIKGAGQLKEDKPVPNSRFPKFLFFASLMLKLDELSEIRKFLSNLELVLKVEFVV